MSEKYVKGIEKFQQRLKDLIAPEDEWNYFGVFDYDYTEIVDDFILTPEIIMIAIADHIYKQTQKNGLVIVNHGRQGKYSLSNSDMFASLKQWSDKKEYAHLLQFSYNDLGIEGKILVDVKSVEEINKMIAKALAKLSERTNYVKPKKIRFKDVKHFSKFLIKTVGPPSLFDDFRNRARGKIKEWGGRNKFISRLFSVTRLIETILTGIGGFIKVIKQHTKDPEYKAWLKKVAEETHGVYNEERLREVMAEFPAVFPKGISIIVTDLFDKYYGFLIPILIHEFLKANPDSFVIIENLPDPEYYSDAARWIADSTAKAGAKLCIYSATRYYPTLEDYTEYFKRFFKDKSIIFNLKADFFHLLHSGESIVVYSWLYEKFSEIEEERLKGEYLFVYHDEHKQLPWQLMSVTKGTLERLKGIFR